MKEKVFVSAYACEPNLGSEIGIGWNWVLEMSKTFELWVLTRQSNKNHIEGWMMENGTIDNIHFVYFDLPKYLRFWKKGLKGVRVYYTLWQRTSNTIVKRIMQENDIKIYHLLTYGNSLWPASRYGMNQFFVWGPTGGVDYISRDFTKFYGVKGKLMQAVRRIIINTLSVNVGFRRKCRKANLILCKSQSLLNVIPPKYKNKAKLFTDGAVDESLIGKYREPHNKEVVFTTVGRLDAWRNFDVLVEAFYLATQKNDNILLNIVGNGNDYNRIQKLIRTRNLEQYIQMTGQVPIDQYEQIMSHSDVIVNPTYKEGAVTMSFDAMAMGKPLICIETGGYTRYFSEENAIILKKTSRDELVTNMSDAIIKLCSQNLRHQLGVHMIETAKKNTWSKKGVEICREIENAYANR